MEYTVKQLAELSGVSVRALHWYDEIGLLVPSFVKSNGYRIYGERELLKLQQILFFRELGLPLKKIEMVVSASDFNQLQALANHKAVLRKGVEKSEQLIETIDKTIKHIKGKIDMKPEDLYYGFDSEKQKQYEEELSQSSDPLMKKGMAEAKERTKNYTPADFKEHKKQSVAFLGKMAAFIKDGCEADSKEVQSIMPEFKDWLEKFYTVTAEVMIGLGDFYRNNSGFDKFYKKHGVDMEFFIKAMRVYAKVELA